MIYVQLLERMALIALAAYIYNQSHIFKNLIKDELKLIDKIIMVIFFSSLSIIGTYTGISLEPYAIANTRPIGAMVAGYVGGPVIGIVVGAIAGVHRYFLGGFTAVACGIASVLEGMSGALARKYSKDGFSVKNGFIGAVIAQMIQMLMLLIFARPLEDAVNLVKLIALPMISINSLGVVIFINIIQNAKDEYNKIGAMQTQKVLNIAKRTMEYMRKGLNEDTAKSISKIICDTTEVNGVAIGDKDGFLAYSGKGIDEKKLKDNLEIYYKSPDYSLIKFKSNNKQVLFTCVPFFLSNMSFEGFLGLEVKENKDNDAYFWNFAKELSELLSTQIELHKLNKLAEEASTAEFRALKAQIQPHFLFNALNTIASFCRTNPLKAKELIIDLSNYFRQTLKREEDFVSLKDELEFIGSYLSIEKARFGDRLKIVMDIPENLMSIKMPVFMLQPIIENAIKHGILPKLSGGAVFVKASCYGKEILFSIEDTGIGMETKKLNEIINKCSGIGLKNVNERLKLLYGEDYGLEISTALDKGTKVNFLIPKEVKMANG